MSKIMIDMISQIPTRNNIKEQILYTDTDSEYVNFGFVFVVVGFSFYGNTPEVMTKGTISLENEDNNEIDKNAIMVKVDNKKVGYLSAEDALFLREKQLNNNNLRVKLKSYDYSIARILVEEPILPKNNSKKLTIKEKKEILISQGRLKKEVVGEQSQDEFD